VAKLLCGLSNQRTSKLHIAYALLQVMWQFTAIVL
jgi:hypothetical protein